MAPRGHLMMCLSMLADSKEIQVKLQCQVSLLLSLKKIGLYGRLKWGKGGQSKSDKVWYSSKGFNFFAIPVDMW